MAESAAPYKPRDTLYLWWLQHPDQPRFIGSLDLVFGGKGVGLRYADRWLSHGFALSEDLPLRSELLVPQAEDAAAGAVDDARPDRWGERVIRRFEKSPRLSVLEYLLFAGHDRFGALGVSQSDEAYVPWATGPAPTLESLEEMAEVVRKVLANETVPELQRRLIRPGVSLGGARPKSVVDIDGLPWIVKFSEGEDMDTELVEHAAMTLAARCGIEVADTRALDAAGRHAIAVKRFDRAPGERIHSLSAKVALTAAGEALGYPQLAQLLRRLAPSAAIGKNQEQLFKRMVFNILIDNTDDHEKNHALLRQPDGFYVLAPAYDVLPSAQGLGYQAMQVGEAGNESTVDNALSQTRAFGLSAKAARDIVHQIARELESWKEHFAAVGVPEGDVTVLAQYIDGDRLAPQRRSYS